MGRPWDVAKGFDQSAPIGPITPFADCPKPKGSIRLMVDGIIRQSGDLSDMIWSPAEIVAEASRYWTLEPGDLIFTGTPEGVGPVVPGQVLYAEITGLAPLDVTLLEPLS